MKEFMKELRKKVAVGLVGGSDFPKLQEQMGGEDGEVKFWKAIGIKSLWWKFVLCQATCEMHIFSRSDTEWNTVLVSNSSVLINWHSFLWFF